MTNVCIVACLILFTVPKHVCAGPRPILGPRPRPPSCCRCLVPDVWTGIFLRWETLASFLISLSELCVAASSLLGALCCQSSSRSPGWREEVVISSLNLYIYISASFINLEHDFPLFTQAVEGVVRGVFACLIKQEFKERQTGFNSCQMFSS